MLRFDHIPPRAPDEVNFIPEAITELDDFDKYTLADHMLLGNALGSLIVANSGETPATPSFEMVDGVVEHLVEQVAPETMEKNLYGMPVVVRAIKHYVKYAKERQLAGAQNV